MRDYLVTLIVFGSIPFIFRRPYIGVLVLAWLGYMNPHRLSWGFAYTMPFVQIITIIVLVAILIDRSKKSIPVNKTTVTWGLFVAWAGVTTIFALFPDNAWTQYVKIIKIQILVVLSLLLITDQRKIDYLIWVIVGSIGFFSIKGGVFTILSGGSFRVWGPPGSYIEENNSLAVATLMIIPLMIYLYQIVDKKIIKHALLASILFSLASSLGSQSRGALLAIIAVACYYWWISPKN